MYEIKYIIVHLAGAWKKTEEDADSEGRRKHTTESIEQSRGYCKCSETQRAPVSLAPAETAKQTLGFVDVPSSEQDKTAWFDAPEKM